MEAGWHVVQHGDGAGGGGAAGRLHNVGHGEALVQDAELALGCRGGGGVEEDPAVLDGPGKKIERKRF